MLHRERVALYEDALRKIALAASDQQENIGLGMPRSGFATYVLTTATDALGARAHASPRALGTTESDPESPTRVMPCRHMSHAPAACPWPDGAIVSTLT